MTNLSDKAAAFLAKNPTFMGRVCDVSFYEHPTKGDESPLVQIKNGQISVSDHWEVPSLEELLG